MSNKQKIIVKRHGKFQMSQMKCGSLYIKGKNVEFRIIRSLGKKYLVTNDEVIGFENFNELWQKLKEKGTTLVIAYDKYKKSSATILI
jgi:hypothetical protein